LLKRDKNQADNTRDLAKPLLDACLENNRKAQIRLYKLYAKQMYNISFRIVKDQMLAEDIIQEAFISAFRGLKNFKREVPFHVWLKKIVINKSLDEIRKNKTRYTELIDDNIAEENGEYDEGDKEELIKRLKDELYQLPDGYRIILSLYYLEGFDHEEISQIMKITASTSRSQLTRARRVLLKRMAKD
jgi:RNA polymerase sigma-70 factor (ECF subfamily)